MSNTQQKDLFAEDAPAPKPKTVFRVNPIHVRRKLHDFLKEFRDLQTWPWAKDQVDLLGTMTLPYFYRKLDNPDEAEKLRVLIDAERARLDADTVWPVE